MDHKETNLSNESAQIPGGTSEVVSRTLDTAIDLLDDIQKVISSGKPKSLRIKFGEKTVAEVPLALTAAAAIAAGLAAVLLTKLAVEVVTED